MSMTTVESVASFSVVLAETFASVGLSTIIPNMFVAAAKSAKAIAAGASGGTTNEAAAVASAKTLWGDKNPGNVALAILEKVGESIDKVDLLIPSKATIDAEFEFHGSDKQQLNAEVGGMIQMVTIKAGYSALYETSSRNKVTLHIEFVSAAVEI